MSKASLQVEYDLLKMQVHNKELEIAEKTAELQVLQRSMEEVGTLLSTQEGGDGDDFNDADTPDNTAEKIMEEQHISFIFYLWLYF